MRTTVSALEHQSRWRIIALATLALAAIAVGQIQRQGDDLLAEMHPPGCVPASVSSLSPSLWNTTSALDIARAVEAWQFHNLEAAGEPVEPVALCAGRRPAGSVTSGLLARRFSTPRQIYQTQLGWLSTHQLLTAGSALAAIAFVCRGRIPFLLTGPLTATGLVAWVVERHQLATLLDRAWFSAQAGGLANPASLEVGVFNWAARVRLVSLGGVLLLIAVAIAPRALQAVRAAYTKSRGARFGLIVVGGASFFMTIVPQADDAVRRWGSGQTALSFAAAISLGIALVAGSAQRRTVIDIVETDDLIQSRNLWDLVPIGLAAAVLAGAAWAFEARGLAVLAAILAAVACVSAALGRSSGVEAVALPAPGSDSARSWLVGIVGSLPVAALGLVAVRVAATDQFALTEPNVGTTGVAGVIALVATGPLASAFASLHLDLSGSTPPLHHRVTSSVAWAVPVLALPVVLHTTRPLGATTLADIGAVAVFLWFFTATLSGLALLHALGDWLVADHRWWRSVLPPALTTLGFRRGPFPALVVVWMLGLSLLGPNGYHDVALAPRGGAAFAPPASRSIDNLADDWGERQDLTRPAAFPALSIASSGGGIRSAYWTAAVLDCLIDGETVGDDPCAGRSTPATVDRRRDSLFLLSGVSGGSVGLVSYVAEVDQGWRTPSGPLAPRWYDQRLGADFQAVVLSHMVTDDALEFFLRTGNGNDRARALEQAFEREWPDGELSRGFLTGQESGEPFLFLAGYSADDGCRFNLSILSANGNRAGSCAAPTQEPAPVLHATTDLTDYLCGDDDVRRSTVALLSARFPYVTPSGHLRTEECHRTPGDTFIVDGGYAGTSGAAAIADLWPALETATGQILRDHSPGSCLVPIHIQIDNQEIDAPSTAGGAPNEALLPIVAVTRAGPGADLAARSAARSLFEPDHYFTIQPVAHPGDEAPLGWTLSATARADLQDQLRTNRTAIETVRRLLDQPTTADCPEPPADQQQDS